MRANKDTLVAADWREYDDDSATLLEIASGWQGPNAPSLANVKLLIEAGVPINHKSIEDNDDFLVISTALLHATKTARPDGGISYAIVEYLLSKGADAACVWARSGE